MITLKPRRSQGKEQEEQEELLVRGVREVGGCRHPSVSLPGKSSWAALPVSYLCTCTSKSTIRRRTSGCTVRSSPPILLLSTWPPALAAQELDLEQLWAEGRLAETRVLQVSDNIFNIKQTAAITAAVG